MSENCRGEWDAAFRRVCRRHNLSGWRADKAEARAVAAGIRRLETAGGEIRNVEAFIEEHIYDA